MQAGNYHSRIIKRLGEIAVVITAVAIGCSDSESEPNSGIDNNNANNNNSSPFVGAAGGTVVAEGGTAMVEIPPGALSSDTPILVEQIPAANLAPLPAEATLAGSVFAFTPHGTTFNVPATVELPYDPTFGGSLEVIRLDDENDTTWESLTGASFMDGTARLQVSRFSVMAVASTPVAQTVGPLTISGLAMPDAAITAHAGAQTFAGTADATGRYTVVIQSVAPTAIVSIIARGSASRGEGAIELATLLDTMSELLVQAGGDGTLDNFDNPGTRLSSLTTTRYVLMTQANSGTRPANRQALLQSERDIDTPSGLKFLDMAAVIQRIIEDPGILAGTSSTTLSFAFDQEDIVRYAYDNSEGFVFIVPVLTATIADLVNQTNLFVPFTDSSTLSVVSRFLPIAKGVVAGGRGPVLHFAGNQTGIYQPWARDRIDPDKPEVGFTWTSSASGARVVTFDESPSTSFAFLSEDEVVALVNDPSLTPAIRTAYQQLGTNQFVLDLDRIEYYRVPGRIEVDIVVEVPVSIYRFASAFAPTGISVPDVEERGAASYSAWKRIGDIALSPFTDQMIRGQTWPIRIFGPARYQSFRGYAAGDDIIGHALVTFNDDPSQTATVRAGTVLADAFTLSWVLRQDGALELMYPDGTAQRIRIAASIGSQYGLWSELDVYGTTFFDFFRSVQVDPSLSVTSTDLVTGPDRYWQTDLNFPFSVRFRDDVLLPEERFGFRFFSNGNADRLFDFDQNGALLAAEMEWKFSINNSLVDIDWYADEFGFFFRRNGCPGIASCTVWRQRQLTPLRVEGESLFVLEWDKRWPSMASATWDDTAQVWRDTNGNPIDDSIFSWIVPPRLNRYLLQDLLRP